MKNKLILLIAVLWIGTTGTARATGQMPDLLIVGGDTMYLFCNPLDSYFDESHPRPNDMWGMVSTACWRGYQAYFEIRSDSLFLTGIRLNRKGDSTDFYPLEILFGDKATPTGVFAYWVNDTLTCIGGDCLLYIHMGYASMYEFDIEYIVQKGLVKKTQVFDNRKSFLPYGTEHDGNTFNYSLMGTFVESQIDYSKLDPDELNDWITIHIKKVDKKGRIKKVEIQDAMSRNQERAIRRALKKVPRFNVLYSRGKPCDEISWRMDLRIYASEEERAEHGPTRGPDIGYWEKKSMSEDEDYVWNLGYLSEKYLDQYTSWKAYIADTSAKEQQYKDYFCQLFNDPLLYQHHYFLTLGDSALKYYYQYWDETGDHDSLYPTIVQLENELGRPHNPKIVQEKRPEFVLFVQPEELDPAKQADYEDVLRRCRQVSYHLRGFGEGDLHEPLPKGVQEEWRLLLLRGFIIKKTSPVLVKVTFDGKEAQIAWRVAKENNYNTYPGLEFFHHGIQSKGERLLSAEEWNELMHLAHTAGIDTLHLDNDYFTSPPAIYNVEHRTTTGYHVVNDYNHPYYSKEINTLFWPYRAFCKYLLFLADPSLSFDSDDEK